MKFIYLADTHLGGNDGHGYRQQNRFLSHARELIECLNKWIVTARDISFIVHGGDMVEVGTLENISFAAELFSMIKIPVYLALGNHDLSEPESYTRWLTHAPQFFGNGNGNFSVIHDPIELNILCVHWGSKPYRWFIDEPQLPYFEPEQLELLKHHSDRIRIIVSHAPPCGLPPAQTGQAEEFHAPLGSFPDQIKDILCRYEPVLLLGAHNHMNLHIDGGTGHLVTVSAFTEAPFEFKVFEINDDGFVSMDTISLAFSMPFRIDYDFNKTYIQGRPCDRSFGNNCCICNHSRKL